MSQLGAVKIIDQLIAAAYSEKFPNRMGHGSRTFHATGETTAGAGTAVFKVWGSNLDSPVMTDDTEWVLLGTISLTTGTTRVSDGFAVTAAWRWIRGELDSVSGTGGKGSLWMAG